MDEFATAFSDADSLFVLDIYPASEQPIEGITGEALAQRIAEKSAGAPSFPGVGKGTDLGAAPPLSRSPRHGGDFVRYVSCFEDAVSAATSGAQPGDMILTLGAGSVSQLGPMLLERLQTAATTIAP
jgi:UDP-N-acetylmuramate--alanine ligase